MTFGLVLPADLLGEIEGVLAHLQKRAQAMCILLADISGQLISMQGQMSDRNATILATLTAGNMAATAEMARRIGEETPFKLLFHEGEWQNIYLSNVGDSFLLAVVFDKKVQIGLVRLFTRQAVKQLLPLAKEFETARTQPRGIIAADFGDILAAEMKNAFGEWEQP